MDTNIYGVAEDMLPDRQMDIDLRLVFKGQVYE
jgi:hypothetical protein